MHRPDLTAMPPDQGALLGPESPAARGGQAFSGPYKAWVLTLVIVIYAFSFMDRVLMSIAAPAVEAEMHLTDAQLGLLIGMAFALVYTFLGIPVARLAERVSRVAIISVTIILWSLMTLGCGTASTYQELLAYRFGVGIGESGATPSTHSLLADYFAGEKRSTVFALYATGVPLGVLLSAFVGGAIVHTHGWREAFIYAGVPGLVLGILAFLTIREPARGASDRTAVNRDVPGIMMVLRRMLGDRATRQMIVATAIGSFAMSAAFLFMPVYFVRVYGMNVAQAGGAFGVIVGLGGIAGNFIGGFLSDYLGRSARVWYGGVPALGFALAAVFALLGFLQTSALLGVSLLFVFSVTVNFWNGPVFSTVLSKLEHRMRATASALLLAVMALIGQGLGPGYLGLASDTFARRAFGRPGFKQMCVLGQHAGPGAFHGGSHAASAVLEQCAQASAHGVRAAMLTIVPILLWAALHYFIAGRHLRSVRN